jgi:hypothetical protein
MASVQSSIPARGGLGPAGKVQGGTRDHLGFNSEGRLGRRSSRRRWSAAPWILGCPVLLLQRPGRQRRRARGRGRCRCACGGGGVLRGRWRGAGWGAPRQRAHGSRRQCAYAPGAPVSSSSPLLGIQGCMANGASPPRLGRLAEHAVGRGASNGTARDARPLGGGGSAQLAGAWTTQFPEGISARAWRRVRWDRLTALTAGTDVGTGPTAHTRQRAWRAWRAARRGSALQSVSPVFISVYSCLTGPNSKSLN